MMETVNEVWAVPEEARTVSAPRKNMMEGSSCRPCRPSSCSYRLFAPRCKNQSSASRTLPRKRMQGQVCACDRERGRG